MSFNFLAKHAWTFNQTLNDEIGSVPFVSQYSPSYSSYISYNLLTMQNDLKYGIVINNSEKYVASTQDLFDYNIIVSFWYYSPRPIGYTKHVVTKQITTKQAPLVSAANFSDTEPVSVSSGVFNISEIADSETKNKIRFKVFASESINYIVESEPYLPGLHHIMCAFSSEKYTIRVDIDGKRGSTTRCSTPWYLPINISINNLVEDYSDHITRQNNGFISDLFIGGMSPESNESIRIVRYGWIYLADSFLMSKRFVNFGFSFPQQTTISSNKSFVKGGHLYVVRSNGEILRGDRPIWDNEHNYTDQYNLKVLNINTPSDQSVAQWTNEGIKLKGSSVRI